MPAFPPSTSPSAAHAARDLCGTQLLEQACEETDSLAAARLREQVVMESQGLAISLARQFEGRGIERDDLVQVAMLGLVQAARRYRPGTGHGFCAFAAPTIRGELKRYFRDHGWAVRPPRGLQELHHEVRGATTALQQDLQREPTVAEIADVLQLPPAEIRRAQLADQQYHSASLSAPTQSAPDLPLGETLPDPGADRYERVESLLSLRSAMRDLDGRDRQILHLRFVQELSQRQIGARIGVSQMQVSRLLGGIYGRLAERLTDPERGGAPTSA